jgi:solute carrier family 35 protein F1/2
MLNVQHPPPDLADDKPSTAQGPTPPITIYQPACHPKTDCSSVGALCRYAWQRFASIWTRRFILSLLAGQIVSLCITCTSVATEALTSRNWALPTTQTLFLCPPFLLRLPVNCLSDISVHRYLSLFVTYTPYTIYRCMPSSRYYAGMSLIPNRRWFLWLAEGHVRAWLEMYIRVL